MKKYLSRVMNKNQTPQSQPIPGTHQVRNSAGGYAWEVDQWERLRRFVILGSEGGSYYASEQKLSLENAKTVLSCIKDDGTRVVNELVEISTTGRAPKNDPAIFALALVASHGDDKSRKAAMDAIPEICRTGTHLFSFAEYVKGMRGWGRGLRRGIGNWYSAKEARSLAYQTVKYRQRGGWTHTDLLRLAHPKPMTEAHGEIYKWITNRDETGWAKGETVPEDEALAFIYAFEQVQRVETLSEVLKLIADYDLPREALPTQWLNETAVWDALLAKMPMTAMIRNLATMTRVGLLTPMSKAEKTVIVRLQYAKLLRKARVHPISVLSALRVYGLGYSLRGQAGPWGMIYRQSTEREWMPTARVLDALDTAFQLAFKNVEPSGKRTLLALDVSGSMAGGMIAGVPGLTPRDGSAAMAMVTARTEPQYDVISFQDKIVPLDISKKMRLDDVIKRTSNLRFGRTDCAQPMLYALTKRMKVDTFVVYTDSETWFGTIHPVQALQRYRDETGIPARLIVVGMVSNGFTIADPNDAGMLDVVGFDAAAPGIMADFARGEL